MGYFEQKCYKRDMSPQLLFFCECCGNIRLLQCEGFSTQFDFGLKYLSGYQSCSILLSIFHSTQSDNKSVIIFIYLLLQCLFFLLFLARSHLFVKQSCVDCLNIDVSLVFLVKAYHFPGGTPDEVELNVGWLVLWFWSCSRYF